MLITSRAIACALAMLLAAPAIAQVAPAAPAKDITDFDDLSTEQQDEIYCVYDAVGSDKEAAVLQDLIVYGELDKQDAANAVFDRAIAACTARHKWNGDQEEVATVVARAGVVADLMEEELRSDGFDDKTFEAVMGVSRKMTPADFTALIEMAYGKKTDEAFFDKMKGLLYEVGVTKEGDVADIAVGFLGASLQERDAIFVWLDSKFY